jgi:hypothetical protein
MCDGNWKLGLKRRNEIAARSIYDIGCSLATDEDYTGSARVRIDASHPVSKLGTHWPSACNREASANHGIEERLPSRTRGSICSVTLGLLESVIDRDWESRVHLFRKALHRLSHASEEKCLRLFFAAVPVRSSHQFLGLRYGDCSEKVGENRF